MFKITEFKNALNLCDKNGKFIDFGRKKKNLLNKLKRFPELKFAGSVSFQSIIISNKKKNKFLIKNILATEDDAKRYLRDLWQKPKILV